MRSGIQRLDRERCADFRRVHAREHGTDFCQCVAWWVATWEEWGGRSAEQNCRLREELFERGEFDGYIQYEDGEPIAWCQVGPRDRLAKLVRTFDLEPDPTTWAITCFLVIPGHRRSGVASRLLAAVLADLPSRGARRVEAVPRRPVAGKELDELDLWNGAEQMFLRAGFELVKEGTPRALLALDL